MKKTFKLFGILFIIFSFSGCFKKDDLEGITIYTTTYPIEYIVNSLYGKHCSIYSIYPNETDINSYDPTDKQIKDYSKSNMFVFNGLGKEKDYLLKMFDLNKNLMIIDATQNIEIDNSETEIWIDPSDFLKVASNVKSGLLEYISNHYLVTEIESNYNDLKIQISNLDANLKLMYENSQHPVIVVDNNSLKFLEKYGYEVISLQEGDSLTSKVKSEVYDLINNGTIGYIYTLDSDNLSQTVNEFTVNTNVKVSELHSLANLTDKERSDGETYISLMKYNISLLKNELYD